MNVSCMCQKCFCKDVDCNPKWDPIYGRQQSRFQRKQPGQRRVFLPFAGRLVRGREETLAHPVRLGNAKGQGISIREPLLFFNRRPVRY